MRGISLSLTVLLALLGGALHPAGANQPPAQQPTPEASATQIRRAKNLIEAERPARAYFDRARAMLRAKGVPFDPDVLRHPQWRRLLAPVFDRMNEMQAVHRAGPKIEGVWFAHTLYLPEKVEVVGDTLILVRNLIHEGRDVHIRGTGGSLYVYPIDRVGLTGTTLGATLRNSASLTNVSYRGTPPGRHALPPLIQGGGVTIDHSVTTIAATGAEGDPGAPAADAMPPLRRAGPGRRLRDQSAWQRGRRRDAGRRR